ncbi:hypothetical protein GCM10023094_38380 [Rhodococcus olei]|uniref:Uncharacterized protein n=1 Tax=Rhodococcus olei TaxID=2161675 RepID=A0ABP8PDC8_9NOCA
MSRTPMRRGASALVAAALLGGAVGLGGGTASAAESSSDAVGSAEFVVNFALLGLLSGSVGAGSIDGADVWAGCGNCPPPDTPIGSIAWDDWLHGRPPGTSMPPPENIG